jgi:hypothetical protein
MRCVLFSTSTVSWLPPRCIIFSNSQRCGQAVLTSLIFFSKRWTAYTNIPSLCVCHEPVSCCRRHRPTSTLHTSRIPHLPYPERIRRTADNRILTIMAPNRHPLWQDEPPLWQSQRRARYAIVGHAEHACLMSCTGNTARIGPRFLLTRDPALIRKMSAVRTPYTRAEWYNCLRLHPTRDNITSYRDETIHNKLRTQMSHGVSFSNV